MIRFATYEKVFFMSAGYVNDIFKKMIADDGKKSISLDECFQHGVCIPTSSDYECHWYSVLMEVRA